MLKEELRKIYLQKRSSLSDLEYNTLNQRLCAAFFQHVDLHKIKVLHLFLPIIKNKEPDTRLIINRVKKEFPQIKISLPRIKNTTDELESFFFEDEQQLEQNKWGIQEPKGGMITNPETIDLVLTPLLAFDKLGQRVGYGKGFYDRFLSSCKPECIKIGLSFFEPIDKIEDANKHDQLLTMAIIPDKVFKF